MKKTRLIGVGTKIFTYSMLMFIQLWGCTLTATNDDDSGISILLPFTDINKTIVIFPYQFCPGPQYKINRSFCVVIENKSGDTIRFSVDLGVKMYYFEHDENQWVELENKINYHGDEVILVPKGDGEWNYLDTVWPILPTTDTPVEVRVIVVGEALRGNEEETVGAYVDVTLTP